MLPEEIKAAVNKMSIEDRVALQSYIKTTLCRNVKLNKERGKYLVEVMENVLGEKLNVKSRESRYVWGRTMIAYQLRQEGFSTSQTGKMIGKDHSSVTHMEKRMNEALQFPQMYWDIMPMWNEFQNRIQ